MTGGAGDKTVEYLTTDHLMAVIADEDTCVGFLLGGIGEINSANEQNFFAVTDSTPDSEIERQFKTFMNRKDIDIILISYENANKIRNTIESYQNVSIPAVIEIPSKTDPYDPKDDLTLKTASQWLM
ncbi:V-type proton ATPase subunit F-like [Aethina tumida]|uniref:V-type proton ATPase subunit F-like n=1 Tax=Aethina tumida TaxID=116153 RepID=UPI00096B57D7|nr:V-type proton ATPase subunit F-like [Aethina tumida]